MKAIHSHSKQYCLQNCRRVCSARFHDAAADEVHPMTKAKPIHWTFAIRGFAEERANFLTLSLREIKKEVDARGGGSGPVPSFVKDSHASPAAVSSFLTLCETSQAQWARPWKFPLQEHSRRFGAEKEASGLSTSLQCCDAHEAYKRCSLPFSKFQSLSLSYQRVKLGFSYSRHSWPSRSSSTCEWQGDNEICCTGREDSADKHCGAGYSSHRHDRARSLFCKRDKSSVQRSRLLHKYVWRILYL